jgi:DNA-binding protein Fis
MEEKSTVPSEFDPYWENGKKMIWFGDHFARNYTRTLTGNQIDKWYELVLAKVTQHQAYELDFITEVCQSCWRIAVKKSPINPQ